MGKIKSTLIVENVIKRCEGDIKAPKPRIGEKENEILLIGITNAITQPRTMMVHVHHAHLSLTCPTLYVPYRCYSDDIEAVSFDYRQHNIEALHNQTDSRNS